MSILSSSIHPAFPVIAGMVVGTGVLYKGLTDAPQGDTPREKVMSSATAPVLGGAALAGVGALLYRANPGAGRLTMLAGAGVMAIPSLIMFPFVNEPSLRDS
jgi:hypothetical protein